MSETLRAALDALRTTIDAIVDWIRAWTPHSRAVVATFGVLWLIFVIASGLTAGTALLVMAAVIVIAAIHLVRGEWRRPRYISPLTLCENAAQRIPTLLTRHADGRWFLADVITVDLNPVDYTELVDHFDVNDVITQIAAEADDVARRHFARTMSGLPPVIQIAPNPKVRAHRFTLRAATHPVSARPVERTRAYPDDADRTRVSGRGNQVPTVIAPDGPYADRTRVSGRGDQVPTVIAPDGHRADRPVLVGPDGRAHPIAGREVTVGRGSGCNITISADTRISRHHLTLALNDGVWWCVDLSSSGVLINSVPITPDTWIELADGDIIGFGSAPGPLAATFYRTWAARVVV